MSISGFGYGSLLNPRDNLIMLCRSYLCFLSLKNCLWLYDYMIVASNFLQLFLNRHVVCLIFLCCGYSTFVDNLLYFAISIKRTLVFISAVAWISLLFFLIENVLVVLFYDLRYILHATLTNSDCVPVKDLA